MRKYEYTHDASAHKVTFIGECANTRHGFKHTVTAFVESLNGYASYERVHTCYYLNRTWECYAYQSAILGVCRDAIKSELEQARAAFMDAHGYARMTAKRRDEYRAYLETFDDKTALVFWCNVYAAYYDGFRDGKHVYGYNGITDDVKPDYDKFGPLYFARL